MLTQPGFFSSDHTVYTITEMFPPRPWRNLLWNEHFIATLDQFGFGASWNQTGEIYSGACPAGESRLMFVRDKQTGACWAANRNFFRETFTEFYTEVGQGYSRIVSCYRGLRFTYHIFVPTQGTLECWTVTLENISSRPRDLSLFAYAASDLNQNLHAAYNHGDFDSELGGVLLTHHAYDVKKELLHHFLVSNRKPTAYETTQRRFRGVYGLLPIPEAIQSGRLASEGTSFDQEMILALQFDLSLVPGQQQTLHFVMGLARSQPEAVQSAHTWLAPGKFAEELAAIQAQTQLAIDKVRIRTPDEDLNRLANVWLKRQVDLGKTWGRTYGRGFRDIMQDTMAWTTLAPDTAAEKIKYCLAYQRPDGNPLRQWEPVDPHPYRDGAVWLILAVTTYLKETGHFDFLNEAVPFYESQASGTVWEHVQRGLNFLLDNLGPHGLCLWGGGDWNDSLNGAGLQGRGESVWLSEAAVVIAREWARLLEHLGNKAEADCLNHQAAALVQRLRHHAWDKDHFICGYTDWDEKVGAYENPGAQIFLNMQTWGVLSGAAENGPALMDFVERELSSPWGYVLNKPGYSHSDDHLGRASYFEKGCYENGSVHPHGGTFKIAADCRLGRGNHAYQTAKMMLATNPANPAERSGAEPYALTNMYLGPENPWRAGESLMGWITGAAGWLFRCLTESMLGVQADYEGLRLWPCLPSYWREVSIQRDYRGALYQITIKNPYGLETGDLQIKVDGQKLPGNILPIFRDGQKHRVEAILNPREDFSVLIKHQPVRGAIPTDLRQ